MLNDDRVVMVGERESVSGRVSMLYDERVAMGGRVSMFNATGHTCK